MRHIPNVLSAIRLILVGVFIFLFARAKYLACLIVFLTAFFTDLLDGYLARRNNWISDLGKVLDPLADKLMVIAALSCFYSAGWLPLWILLAVLIKEGIMIIGGLLLFRKEVVVYADWYGKFAAGFFNAGVALTLLKNFWPWIGMLNIIVFCIAIVLAVIALCHYAKVQVFNREKKESYQSISKEPPCTALFFLPLPALCSRIALCGGGFWGIICVGTPMRACMRA